VVALVSDDPSRTCDVCRVKPAVRLLVRADLGVADDRMLVCSSCKPAEGTWNAMARDADGLAREARTK
jgi:hypothetical protein